MLVLSRKIGEQIHIGDNIKIVLLRITGGGVRIGIEAPKDLPIIRAELKVGEIETLTNLPKELGNDLN